MVRILFTYVLPLILPTVLYFAWAAWVRRSLAAKRGKGPAREDEIAQYEISTPWFRLILAGVALMAVSLVLSVFFGPSNPPGSVYHPPRLENGKVVPGQYAPKDNP